MIESKVVDACCLEPLPTTPQDGEWLISALKALADPTRLEIVQVLSQVCGETCVCNLTARFDIPQNLLSHHLKVLREAGLVQARKRGRWVDYRLDAAGMARLHARLPVPAAMQRGA